MKNVHTGNMNTNLYLFEMFYCKKSVFVYQKIKRHFVNKTKTWFLFVFLKKSTIVLNTIFHVFNNHILMFCILQKILNLFFVYFIPMPNVNKNMPKKEILILFFVYSSSISTYVNKMTGYEQLMCFVYTTYKLLCFVTCLKYEKILHMKNYLS